MTVVAEPRRTGTHERPRPSALRQWWVLSMRIIVPMMTGTEWFMAVLSPVIFTIGFYLPLKYVMSIQGIDYGQFLMPIIVLQSMAFTAISASFRAARDGVAGITRRFNTMPIVAGMPLAARTTATCLRLLISLVAAIACGYAIGFRFELGAAQSWLFCVISLAIGMTLSLGADAIGTISESPEMTSQALMLPQLILGMLSSGFVPITGFPEWIQPFVRNQPISLFATAMRDMTSTGITWPVLAPALYWIIGLIVVFVPLSIWASLRRK